MQMRKQRHGKVIQWLRSHGSITKGLGFENRQSKSKAHTHNLYDDVDDETKPMVFIPVLNNSRRKQTRQY